MQKNMVYKTAKVTWCRSCGSVVVLGFPCLYILLYKSLGGVRQNRFALLPLALLSLSLLLLLATHAGYTRPSRIL